MENLPENNQISPEHKALATSVSKPDYTKWIALLSVIGILAVILFFISSKNRNKSAEPKSVEHKETLNQQQQQEMAQNEPNPAGNFIFVQDGDVWVSNGGGQERVKLVDIDKAESALLSPNKNFIAYTILVTTSETYKGYPRQEYQHHRMLLANKQGSNSVLVKEAVNRWGWVPGTELLWYEPASLQEFFGPGYFGEGSVILFDPISKNSTAIVDTNSVWSLLRPLWSPDGSKLAYAEEGVLKITDRTTRNTTNLLNLPYVGGDRGGPAPIPAFYWSADSKHIYIVFTPLLTQWTDPDDSSKDLASGYIHAYRIDTATGNKNQLLPFGQIPSAVTNEEVPFPGTFSEDFSKIIYWRYKTQDIVGLTPEQWVYSGNAKGSPYLVMYDLQTGLESVLLENIKDYGKTYFNSASQPNYAPAFITKESIYFLVRKYEASNWVSLTEIKIDTKNKKAYIFDIPNSGNDTNMIDLLLSVKFDSNTGKLYYIRNNNGYVLFDGRETVLIENISSLDYVPE
jgi:hypothetical protein